MKAVILAGGLGTRLSEETHLRPKPMVEIGSKPILWHIMKIYSSHGINDFIICCGYKGYVIKEYFANYLLHECDVNISTDPSKINISSDAIDSWNIDLVNTGELTMTGGRLKRVQQYLDGDSFCFTYGDGVSDVDIKSLIDYHREQGDWLRYGSPAPGRYGSLVCFGRRSDRFQEKPQGDGLWINGGFFVLEPEVLDD